MKAKTKKMELLGKVIGFVTLIGLFALLLGLPLMLLWNWLMPEIFGMPEIGFLQAIGLLLLSGLLFKNSSSSK